MRAKASAAKQAGAAGQEILLILIRLSASREERTKFYSLMPFVSVLENKACAKVAARAKNCFLQTVFRLSRETGQPGNSLAQIRSGKKRRKFCPLLPCLPDLARLEGIAAGKRWRQASDGGRQRLAAGRHPQRAGARDAAARKKGPQDECLKALLLSFYLNISFSFSAKLPFFW